MPYEKVKTADDVFARLERADKMIEKQKGWFFTTHHTSEVEVLLQELRELLDAGRKVSIHSGMGQHGSKNVYMRKINALKEKCRS